MEIRTGTRGEVVVMGVVKVEVEVKGRMESSRSFACGKKNQAAEHTSDIELVTPVLANCTEYSHSGRQNLISDSDTNARPTAVI